LVRERATFVADIWEQSWFFFVAPEEYDGKIVKKRWKENSPEILKEVIDLLGQIDDFTSKKIEDRVKSYLEEKELGFGAVMNVFRLCLVGSGMGPHLFDIAEILGKQETINRIEKGIQMIP